MRETAAGTLFTWSKNRRFYCRFFSWPAPLCFFFVITLLIEATRFGVSERIGNESFICCGMLLNTSQSRWTNFSCVCDIGMNRTLCRGGVSNGSLYPLHFCRSIPLCKLLNSAVLQNRTLCHKQLKKLQEADKSANGSYKMFEEIIARMDCGEDGKNHTYSVTSTCQDCLAAYKNWVCLTEVSAAILDLNESAHLWKRPCPRFCETVLQKCPYIPPVPNSGDSLVQVGYSAFNCLDHEEWTHTYGSLEDQCVDVEPLQENDEDYCEQTFKPTETTKGVAAMNSTTSSSTNGSKR